LSENRVAVTALLACALLAGGNGVGIRFSNRELAPLWGASVRFALAAVLLFVVATVLGLALPRGRALAGAVLFGLLNFAGGFGVLYIALVDLHAGFGTILLGLVPLATLLLACAWRQERLRASALIGVALALTGVVVMSQGALRGEIPVSAMIAALISALSLAQAAVLVRQLRAVHPVTMNGIGMLAGAVALLIASAMLGERWAVPTHPHTWLALGYLVVAGSVLVFVLYLLVMRYWDASRAAYVFVLSPVGAVALSAWLDDEPVGAPLVFGGLAVLAGVYFGALRRTSQAEAVRNLRSTG
jgi:drug/metabolite transporter (DMT)-like permease